MEVTGEERGGNPDKGLRPEKVKEVVGLATGLHKPISLKRDNYYH